MDVWDNTLGRAKIRGGGEEKLGWAVPRSRVEVRRKLAGPCQDQGWGEGWLGRGSDSLEGRLSVCHVVVTLILEISGKTGPL